MAPIQNQLTHRTSHRFKAFHRYGFWHPLSWTVFAAALVSLTVLDIGRSRAETVTLLNGLQLNGKIRTINSVSENPVDPVHPGSVLGRIIVVDNGLRRFYIPRKAIRAGGLAPDALLNTEIIELRKRVLSTTREVGALGTIITVSKFDEFGNRTCKIRSSKGPVDILQCKCVVLRGKIMCFSDKGLPGVSGQASEEHWMSPVSPVSRPASLGAPCALPGQRRPRPPHAALRLTGRTPS